MVGRVHIICNVGNRARVRHSRTVLVSPRVAALFLCAGLLVHGPLAAEPVAVRYSEGLVHGFLVLRTLSGQTLADGDLIQVASSGRVTTRMVFRFRDGSYHEESAVYSQNRQFRLLKYHLVQKGRSFPRPLELSIDGGSGQVTVRYQDDGKQKVVEERMELPPDLANGMISVLMKNIPPAAQKATLSMLAATPKPQLVKLDVTRGGDEPFTTGRAARKASHFVLKVDIPGLKGLVAPLVGKEPPDNHVWILGGEAPAFVKSESPFYVGGPSWRIELVSPTWPRTAAAASQR